MEVTKALAIKLILCTTSVLAHDSHVVGGICFHETDPLWLKAYCRHQIAQQLLGDPEQPLRSTGSILVVSAGGLHSVNMERVRTPAEVSEVLERYAALFEGQNNALPEYAVDVNRIDKETWKLSVDAFFYHRKPLTNPVEHFVSRLKMARYWFHKVDSWLLVSRSRDAINIASPTTAWNAVRRRLGEEARGTKATPVLTIWFTPQQIPHQQRAAILQGIARTVAPRSQRGNHESAASHKARLKRITARLSLAVGLLRDTESIKLVVDRVSNQYKLRATWTARAGSDLQKSFEKAPLRRQVAIPGADRCLLTVACDPTSLGLAVGPVLSKIVMKGDRMIVSGSQNVLAFWADMINASKLSKSPAETLESGFF